MFLVFFEGLRVTCGPEASQWAAVDRQPPAEASQWAALALPFLSEGSLLGASSVCAEVVSEPVLLSLVPSSMVSSSMAPSGTLSFSDAASSLPGRGSSSSEAFGFSEVRETKKDA